MVHIFKLGHLGKSLAEAIAIASTTLLGSSLLYSAEAAEFKMPFKGNIYVKAIGGGAAASSAFGLGTSPANFQAALTDLPNFPSPPNKVLLGSFSQDQAVNLALKTDWFGESFFSFLGGTDTNSKQAFTKTDNSSAIVATGLNTFTLFLDDAISLNNNDDDDDDVIIEMELEAVPEPMALTGMVVALGAAGWLRRRSLITTK